ncbi:TonB-dependent receptor [Cronbergia sp. UHCC 0137]|uniref:TonB-dependent receptor domain-containing protein n=1 Tax=Cronbergia sp. UHCC 0137 TaxID=3110239 RepID=UPI002B209AD8|nr:TonB-dependent receptor [Cronbergia sp. UHCC 0137]MEA5617128.1 TonB-dependent receptor [Cronbergia sp. UHCC 0137]
MDTIPKSLCIAGLGTIIPALLAIAFPAYADMTVNREQVTTQAVESEIISITNVKVNSTDTGIEVILETSQGQALEVSFGNDGNKYIANIPKAQLALPNNNTFTLDNPTAGITQIQVINQDSNTIRVTVTGDENLPQVELFDDDQGLIFGVVASTLETQPPEQAENETIELTVTAQKTEQNLQDTPISITAIGEQEIEDAGISNIQSIANNTPNFSVFSSSGGRNFTFYSIRGLSNSNFLSRGDVVGFYVDDVPYEYGGFLDQEFLDLERVEVLRGPQSTLYGKNSQGGVVNIISRKPTNTPEIKTSVSYGSYNLRNLQLSLSDAIIPDRLFFRLAGGYKARDGYGQNILDGSNLGEQSSITGRGQILWTPSPDWTISLNATGAYNNDSGSALADLNSPNRYDTAINDNGFVQLSTNSQALRIGYDGERFRATAITVHRKFNQDSGSDADLSPVDLIRNINNFSSDLWSQEIRFQSPSNANKLRWLIGGYYETTTFDYLEAYNYTPLGAATFGFPTVGTDRIVANSSSDTVAAFTQIDYKPIEPLTLTAGLRYESANSKISRNRNFEVNGISAFSTGANFTDEKVSGSELLPKIGVEYRFNPNLLAYASATRSYKPGGVNYRAEVADSLRFNAETGWNYEVGLKSSWLDDSLIANLAVFTTQINNYQVALPDQTGFFRNVANAGVSISGAEFEVKAKPIQGLELSLGFGYTDGKYTEYTNPLTGQDFSGNRLAYSPEYTYNLAAQYRSLGGIFARLELQGFGSYVFDEAATLKQKPFALVNARIGYEKDSYGIYLFANNLFDTRYLTSAFIFPPPNVIGRFGDPTTIGVQLKVNF